MKRRMTADELLQARIQELAQAAVSHATSAQLGPDVVPDFSSTDTAATHSETSEAVPPVLVLCGMLMWRERSWPCTSFVFQWLARSIVFVFSLMFFLPGMRPLALEAWHDEPFLPDCSGIGTKCWSQPGFVSQVPLPLGAILVSAVFFAKPQQRQLLQTLTLLYGVAVERGFQDWRLRRICIEKVVFVGIWMGIVVTTAICDVLTGGDTATRDLKRVALHVFLVSLFSAVILGLAFGMAFVCRSLSVMIDTFCCDVVGTVPLEEVGHIWNLTQAVLRKASVSIEVRVGFLLLGGKSPKRSAKWGSEEELSRSPRRKSTGGIFPHSSDGATWRARLACVAVGGCDCMRQVLCVLFTRSTQRVASHGKAAPRLYMRGLQSRVNKLQIDANPSSAPPYAQDRERRHAHEAHFVTCFSSCSSSSAPPVAQSGYTPSSSDEHYVPRHLCGPCRVPALA